MSGSIVTLLASLLSFGGGTLSSFLILRGQKMSVSVQSKAANTQQVEMIFGGYSQIVDDLQNEVQRLKETIEDLRSEQEACEARNVVLHNELLELRARIALIESRD